MILHLAITTDSYAYAVLIVQGDRPRRFKIDPHNRKMAAFSSADDELQHLQQLDRASEQLVQNLEGMLDKFKTLNEGAKGA